MLRSTDGLTAVFSRSPEAPAPHNDRRVRVLILIPTLDVGGAEMDLVRTLPRIDRTRFEVSVCTFLVRGELGKILQDQGIDVVGPFSASLYWLRHILGRILRRIARRMSALFWEPVAEKLYALRRVVRRIPYPMRSLLKTAAAMLRQVAEICRKPLRAFYSIRAVVYLSEVVRLARPIASHIRASEIDVIHTVLPNSYLVGACASALAGGRPILMSRLSLNLYQQEHRLLGFIERRILHHVVDAAIGNSSAVLRDLEAEGIHRSKLHLVYNGIDARAFADQMVDRSIARRLLEIPDDTLVFSVVANLYPYKGHGGLLAALAALPNALASDWICLLVGKDVHDKLPELKRLCHDHGLSRNVRFLGPRADIPVILSASDIHISASHQEGLPNNIIEAMCARLPVVATAVGGVPELVVDGETGYLLPPQDAGRMTDALLALAKAPSRRRAFGEAGYARAVSHFNLDNNVRAFETIYAGLAGRRSRDRSPDRSRSPGLRTTGLEGGRPSASIQPDADLLRGHEITGARQTSSPMSRTESRSIANFDIGVLFYNRARQTLDCVLSFLNEDIQPNIVILDQGSAAEQRRLLDNALGHRSNVRWVTLTENIGVAAGRNRLCRECSAGWVLFVDSDMMLNTRGGVELINSTVECAEDVDGFSPRILNVHENRFMDRRRLTQTTEGLRSEPAPSDVATTNMFAGGAVVLRRSILLDSPYDERYFVGFEDFDRALCAFSGGRPLRLESLDDVTLVHKHMPVIGEPDVASTRTRYSSPLIAKSFDLLKTKYGGDLFDHWEPWAANQQREMIVSRRIAPRIRGDTINVTFVVDVPNWAFDNVVRNLDLHIGDEHVLTIVYAQQDDDVARSLRRILDSCPHVIHFMWRADFRRLVCTTAIKGCAALMGVSEAEIVDRLCQSHNTFSVCDHLFLSEADIDLFRPLYWLSDGYCVTSPMLSDIYRRISDYPKPAALILNGVDRTLYRPSGRATRKKSTLTVGWVGNSRWGEGQDLTDAKGLRTIIRPSVEMLRAEGIDVELLVLDRAERWRPREEVAALYREMDLYVCASSIEGTPNTVLEAMASGVPVVATRVGIVPDVFGPRQQAFVVERSVEAFSEAMRRLCSDSGLRRSLAEENLQQMTKHDWASRAPLWRRFFADVMRQAHPDAATWKRFMIEKFFLDRG